jgi:DNA-binding MarR family transcriptional regulator
MGVTNGGATQMIEVMVKRNLVERISDTHDRRVTHVILTSDGKLLAQDVRKRHGAAMAKILKGMEHEEVEQLVALLQKVRTHIESNQELIKSTLINTNN